MQGYEKLAEYILKEITENPKAKSIEISMQQAVMVYTYLLGLSRIAEIVESEDGGAKHWT